MSDKTLAQTLAAAIQAWKNTQTSDRLNPVWESVWDDVIDSVTQELPQGSGFDSYPVVDRERSTGDKLVINGSYHSMDEHGGYNGWCDYTVFVRPAFDGIIVTVTGGGKYHEDIGDRFYDAFSQTYNLSIRPPSSPRSEGSQGHLSGGSLG